MSFTVALADRAAALVASRTSRRGFLGRTAIVGSALTVAAPTYVLRPGTAYAAVTRTRCGDCGGTGLCCDGYTDFCCHLYEDNQNECPPGTILAGWWKVDNSDFCFGTARYYLDCNKQDPGCACGRSGACQDDPSQCGCVDCQSRKDGCTVFRYGNCHNEIACVGPIMCRVVTCTKPWEIEPTCSQVARTDNLTRNHHRPCLERDPDAAELALVRAWYEDFLGRPSDASGEAYWGNLLVRGSHLDEGVRPVLAESFAFSEEYVSFVVDQIYREVFDRGVDEDGAAHWTEQLRDGMTPGELTAALYASDEFFEASDEDPATFVGRVYRRMLGREAADAEVEGWVEALDGGMTREALATGIHGSVEARRGRVRVLYERFLGRRAEDEGRDYWVEVLEDEQALSLALFLAVSDEYAERALRRFPPPEDEEPDPEPVEDEPAVLG